MVKAKVFVKAQEFVGFPSVDNFKLETQEVDDNLCEGGIFKEFCLKSSFLFALSSRCYLSCSRHGHCFNFNILIAQRLTLFYRVPH